MREGEISECLVDERGSDEVGGGGGGGVMRE